MKTKTDGNGDLALALERERLLLAAELHEGLCQSLCSLSIQLKVLERKLARISPEGARDCTELQRNLDETIEQSRVLFRKLKPPVADVESLEAALTELAETCGGKVRCEFVVEAGAMAISSAQAQALLRIAQAAVGEGCAAPAVKRILLSLHAGDAKVKIAISDNRPLSAGPRDPIAIRVMASHAEAAGAHLKWLGPEKHSLVECQLNSR